MTGLVTRPEGSRTSRPTRQRAPLALLVMGNAASLVGNVVMTVAVPWLVLTTSGSAALAGVVVFSGVASAALGGLAAGRVVDVVGPVRASAAADLLSALSVAPLAVLVGLDALPLWTLLALTVVGTLADASGSAARQGLVPVAADVGGYRRERANALFTSAEHIGYLVGAPAAGLLIAITGIGATLWVAVGMFAVAALVAVALAPLRALTRTSSGGLAPVDRRAGLGEALAFIWRDPALRALVVFPTTAVLLVGPLAPLVLPVLARDVFDDPVVLGVMVAGYGAGGLVGAAAFGLLGPRIPRRRLYVGIFVVWPCAYAVITLVPYLPVVMVSLVVLGAAAGSLVPLQATIRQERSPAPLLPRVVALSTATIPVAGPTGVLVTGFLIDGLGLRHAALLLSGVALLVGVAVVTSRATRRFTGPGQ